MHDRYRNRYRLPAASARLRQQIALEAARRLYRSLVAAGQGPVRNWPEAASPNDLYVAKRKAAAVLGHRIRPGDLPSDGEVRQQMTTLVRDGCVGPERAPRRTQSPTHRLFRWPITSTGSRSTRCGWSRWSR